MKISLKKIIESDSEISIYNKDVEQDSLIISVSKNKTPEEVNRYFFDKGVVLSELVVYNESLENQFLNIIKEG